MATNKSIPGFLVYMLLLSRKIDWTAGWWDRGMSLRVLLLLHVLQLLLQMLLQMLLLLQQQVLLLLLLILQEVLLCPLLVFRERRFIAVVSVVYIHLAGTQMLMLMLLQLGMAVGQLLLLPGPLVNSTA